MADLLTSDQVNYMIWRYLQESGFRESAYALQRDSKVDRLDSSYRAHVKSGILIYLIQRGLQYEELAAQVDRLSHLIKNGTVSSKTRSFQFLPSSVALVIDEDEGVGSDNNHMEEDDDDDDDDDDSITVQSKSPQANSVTSANAKKHGIDDTLNGVSKKRRKKASNGLDGDVHMADSVPSPPLTEELPVTNGRSVGTQIEDAAEILKADTLLIEEGDKGVISCAWNPAVSTLLATASVGSIARIWNMLEGATSPDALRHIELPHEPSRTSGDKSNVIAIRWSSGGNRLASGSYDGQTRIWSVDGVLEHNMLLHYAPITCLKWNRAATFLLALSCDGKMIAWDASSGESHQVFDLGKEAVADIEWISDSQFIACGESGHIYQFDIGVDGPVHSRKVHDGEVSCIAWDEPTETIATGGQDASILIWHKPSSDSTPERKLRGHTGQVVSVAWQPGSDFIPASPKRILASASNDCSVRLWEVVSQTCLHILQQHSDPIERICFSPDGNNLASGANGAVLIWKTDSGALTHVYDRAKTRRKNSVAVSEDFSEISQISWDETGQRLAIGEGHKCVVLRLNAKLPVAI